MKKIFVCLLSFVSVTVAAQISDVTEFTKKISYKIDENPVDSLMLYEYKTLLYEHLIGKNKNEALINIYYNSGNDSPSYNSEVNYFIKDNLMVPVYVSGISNTVRYDYYSVSKMLQDGQELKKIDRTGKINGIDCQYYGVTSAQYKLTDYSVCYCIDENNKIDNIQNAYPNSSVKGLILSIEDESNTYKLVLDKIEDINLKLNFSGSKFLEGYKKFELENELAAQEYAEEIYPESEASLDNDYSIYSDPLYTYTESAIVIDDYNLYSFITPIYSITGNMLYKTKEYYNNGTVKRDDIAKYYEKTFKAIIKNAKSNKLISSDENKLLNDFFKEQLKAIKEYKVTGTVIDQAGYDDAIYAAAEALEAYDASDWYDAFYSKYESNYNDIEVNDSTIAFAYDILDDEKFKTNAPEFCNDLKNKVPKFENKNLQTHTYNLAGQICDLYLYNNGGNVDYYGTINSMRKSFLEIEKLRSTLSQNDQKLLLQFLKSLD